MKLLKPFKDNLLTKEEFGCICNHFQMIDMSKGEELFPPRALYSTFNSNAASGGCKYKFYYGTPKNSKEERCHHGSS